MSLPTDPLLSRQWHLQNTTTGLLDLNVTGVWDPLEGPAYTGLGVRVVVIDTGFDYAHEDLAGNYNTTLDYDFAGGDSDPFGSTSDAHGTLISGTIGAVGDNGVGGVGVAYQTELVGYQIVDPLEDAGLQHIRDAIYQAAVVAQGDLANICHSIERNTESEFGVGYDPVRFDEIEASIGIAVSQGRGGLGMTIVKAAGNARGASYDINADDFANDTRMVVVAGVNQNGFVSSYSTYGASILVSAFGSPGEVVTTDRTGAAGNSPDSYVTDFAGTSAASAMVSGVVALMYDANAGLGWRDVQSILSASARQVGSEMGAGLTGAERFAWGWNKAQTWNGGGLHFSNDYGYGLVDALAAVRLAETWHLTGTAAARSGNEFTSTMDALDASVVIPDGNTTGRTFTASAGSAGVVERVTVQMSFATTFAGDLEVYLTSPGGTVSRLIRDTGQSNDFAGTWTFETQAFRGEQAAGTWSVRVVDDATGNPLTVSDVAVTTWGAASLDDRYVFTNAYSDYANVAGHRTAISDGNGGADTVNAAAVSSNSVIRLNGQSGSIDGVAVTFTNIEHAIGGDGADQIVGSNSANRLFGMRGQDVITGGTGNDTLEGGTGSDVLLGGAGKDTLVGAAGSDTFRFTSKADSPLSGFDIIQDFEAAGAASGDLIDLSSIDAKESIAGNQAFILNSTAIGGLRISEAGTTTRIQGFTNSASGADFQIDITDGAVTASHYTAADFLL